MIRQLKSEKATFNFQLLRSVYILFGSENFSALMNECVSASAQENGQKLRVSYLSAPNYVCICASLAFLGLFLLHLNGT